MRQKNSPGWVTGADDVVGAAAPTLVQVYHTPVCVFPQIRNLADLADAAQARAERCQAVAEFCALTGDWAGRERWRRLAERHRAIHRAAADEWGGSHE